MKFIHLADAHLDSPFRGLSFLPYKTYEEIKSAAEKSFQRICDLALAQEVDLVLIAGDTFDSNKPSPKSQLFFAEQVKRLTDAEIEVVMIFGNHDYMDLNSLFVNASPYFHLLGNGQKVEKISLKTKQGFEYNVVGFSYQNNHITENMVSKFPVKDSNYNIGLMHAGVKTTEAYQNVYAPFEVAELRNLDYDYFALGHIHARQVLSQKPLIIYPGNIQGRHINELSEKGCYLAIVDEERKETKISFEKTAPILWKKLELTLTEQLSKAELQNWLISELNKANKELTFFYVVINKAQFLSEAQIELITDSDFWNNLSQNLAFSSQVIDLRLKSNLQIKLGAKEQKAFSEAKLESTNKEAFLKLAQDLIKKDQYLAKLCQREDFQQETVERALVILAQSMKGIDDETNEN